jgi:PAS domain S-box-containing protein
MLTRASRSLARRVAHLLPSTPPTFWKGQLIAIACAAAGGISRLLVEPLVDDGIPVVLFYPFVLIASAWGGTFSGITTLILAAGIANFFFMPPFWQFTLDKPAAVTLTAFSIACGVVIAMTGVFRAVVDIHREAQQLLKENEARFEAFAQAMPNQVWSATPDGQLDWINNQVFAYSGFTFDDLAGSQWSRMVHPADLAAAATTWAKSLSEGTEYQTEFRLRRADGSFRWHLARALPIKDPSGQITRWIGTNTDIEHHKAIEAQQELLTHELEHRMKNTMAMISAIAAQTFRAAATKEEARTTFIDRLSAFNRAHDLLVKTSWTTAPMTTVAEGALAPHDAGEGKIRINGDAIVLTARQAMSLSLVLHELATNAVKYGALSVADGTVDVTWTCDVRDETRVLSFRWREAGGPKVAPPSRRGFGSRLIESTLSGDFGASVKIEYAPDGLVCEFDALMTQADLSMLASTHGEQGAVADNLL